MATLLDAILASLGEINRKLDVICSHGHLPRRSIRARGRHKRRREPGNSDESGPEDSPDVHAPGVDGGACDRRRKRQRTITSESESEGTSDCESGRVPLCVNEEAEGCEEEGCRTCIKVVKYDPVVVVGTKESGSRLYKPLERTITLKRKANTRASKTREQDFFFQYNPAAAIQDEDDLTGCEKIHDVSMCPDNSTWFVNPLTNKRFGVVPRVKNMQLAAVKRVFLALREKTSCHIKKREEILSLLESAMKEEHPDVLHFGSKSSNSPANDELHDILFDEQNLPDVSKLPMALPGRLCDACNLRKPITHTWDDHLNLGQMCAAKLQGLVNTYKTIPRSNTEAETHGEHMFVAFMVEISNLLGL